MSQLVTRCPHCSTSFHVNDQQLRAARGAVRCGSCLQVFRADENIVFNDNGPDTRSDLETLLEDDDFLIHDDIELEDDDPADADKAASNSANAKQPPIDFEAGEPAEDTQPEAPPANSESLIGDAFGDNEWQELQEENHHEEAQEEDLESVLKPDWDDLPDFDNSTTGNRVDTDYDNRDTTHKNDSLNDLDPWEQPLEAQTTATEPSDLKSTSETPPSSEEIFPTSQPEASGQRREPYFATEAEDTPEPQAEPAREQLISAIQPAPLEMSWGATPSKKAVSPWLWRLLLPALVILLLLQVGYFQFDRLSKQQPWRKIYAVACPLFGCTLPPLRDARAIQASNLMVRSHPQLEGALIVDAVLLNTAPYPQAFPNLLLNFSDLKNKAVASRRFSPQEYLQGELAGRKLMPQGSPIHIAIEVVDPGAEAVNYEMKIAP
ncbi:DUF3426 domain-containing protein [Microbulbifer sp. DLAB2-AA]|uniref:DUF3426 domain-containing protein n=1 Tax=Microbulbifer sp. DLAB2-AA TaxID=3243394 RepID=UPI004039D28D